MIKILFKFGRTCISFLLTITNKIGFPGVFNSVPLSRFTANQDELRDYIDGKPLFFCRIWGLYTAFGGIVQGNILVDL
jgi:hypothetical protein